MEVTEVDQFFDSFRKHLPSFVPPFYSVGNVVSGVNKKFPSSPVHLLILKEAMKSNMFQLFQWYPPYCLDSNPVNVIIHLRVCFDDRSVPKFFEKDISLRCKTLSVRFFTDFKISDWPNVIQLLERIERETIAFLIEEEESLAFNYALLVSLHKELTEGKWKEQKINRLKFRMNESDDVKCLPLLIDLVERGKIEDGVLIAIAKSNRIEEEKERMKSGLESLFNSVVQSKTIDDFFVRNWDSSVSPIFDLSVVKGERQRSWKSLYFDGPVFLVGGKASEKILVEEANVLSWNEESNSNFIRHIQSTKYLSCWMKCFELLAQNEIENILEIEELCIDVQKSPLLNLNIVKLTHLTVLTLNFVIMQSFSPDCDFKLDRLVWGLSLRVLELIQIPLSATSFDFLVDSLVRGFDRKREQLPQTTSTSNDPQFLLDDLVINFNAKNVSDVDSKWDALIGCSGMRGIQTILKRKQLGRFCWVDAYSNLPLQTLPQTPFPFNNGFAMNVQLDGSDSTHSRHSQCNYRWLNVTNRYCITIVEK